MGQCSSRPTVASVATVGEATSTELFNAQQDTWASWLIVDVRSTMDYATAHADAAEPLEAALQSLSGLVARIARSQVPTAWSVRVFVMGDHGPVQKALKSLGGVHIEIGIAGSLRVALLACRGGYAEYARHVQRMRNDM